MGWVGPGVRPGVVASVVTLSARSPENERESAAWQRANEVTYPLIVLAGPTGSGKSRLAITLAETLGGEIISCDSVAVYRGLEIGSAKPSQADRVRVPHHGLDLFAPDEACTAGDYARAARAALAEVKTRGKVPIVAGGTGLYLRALLEGLAPAPKRNEPLRERLRARAARRGSASLHRLLRHLDARAAEVIHPNDLPKLVRSLEVSLSARQPQSEQWLAGRDALRGYSVLQLGLNPPREALYARLNARAARMFSDGLVDEACALLQRYGPDCMALRALGYAQAKEVLAGRMTLDRAITDLQQGHRNYAKRQLTWFRREAGMYWLVGFGDDPAVLAEALRYVREHFTGLPFPIQVKRQPEAGARVESSETEDHTRPASEAA